MHTPSDDDCGNACHGGVWEAFPQTDLEGGCENSASHSGNYRWMKFIMLLY